MKRPSTVQALDIAYPGWRFAQRRVQRAGDAMLELGEVELSAHVREVRPVAQQTLRALYGTDRVVVSEWNAALAYRALVAPLIASSHAV